ncbi:TetR/AcrR family transcriptional regulator [Streptomyces niger]|uniref:TetR/AcrR family transcriptional regulator n=1 Tax=Streptomyces niger TaxID=66373 RepID=UPI000699D7A5|nr:TetR/AcrR family transcriptional regulator [Streptomyces niger]
MYAKQARAEQTQRRLLGAAAAELARHGYAGTSLSRVSARADVTMGALTFHFPSKAHLAEAVHRQGHEATRALVGRVAARGLSPLQSIIDLSHGLLALLRENDAVRAAWRSSRDGAAREDWYDGWLPWTEQRAVVAGREHQLRPGCRPDLLPLFVECLVPGVAERLDGTSAHHDLLTALWAGLLPGIAAPGCLDFLHPGGAPP